MMAVHLLSAETIMPLTLLLAGPDCAHHYRHALLDAADHARCQQQPALVQRPDWHVRFDVDKEMGAATRRQVLARLAEERIPFIGYHMPFPALGFIAPNGEGSYRFVPASYQFAE